MHGNAATYNGQPCPHMVTLVSAYADGALRGFARWYTRLHVGGCPRCQAALDAVKKLKERLEAIRAQLPDSTPYSLAEKRWESLEAAWAEAEERGP